VEGDAEAKPRKYKVILVEHAGGAADVPPGAIVTAEQAESALGHVQATDLDADIFESLDEDQKEEEMALIGRIVNPPLLTYDCIAWSPVSNSELANTMGWHPPLLLQHLTAAAFTCTGAQVRATLEESFIALRQYFVEEMCAPDAIFKLAASVESLDPTQLEAYKTITEWAQQRYDWEKAPDSVRAPELQFLLLGTAGTGKTHTAKAGVTQVRQLFHDFHAVLTIAFSGVAAANLGSGSQTIDSIFHTNSQDAAKDIVGDQLDRLVRTLRAVKLIVIDEISTVGASQFAIIARRCLRWGVCCGENAFLESRRKTLEPLVASGYFSWATLRSCLLCSVAHS
jgi:DNA replication protein DnaC